MKDLMIDLETLGTNFNAPMIQFGGVYFNRYTGETGKSILINIDFTDSLKYGFEMDGDTIKFWLNQDKETIESVIKKSFPLSQALMAINLFIKKDSIIWCHPNFDFPILDNHFRKNNRKCNNLLYKNIRCLRTITDIVNYDYYKDIRSGKHHNALDDCLFQINYVTKCFNKLKKRGELDA